MWRPSAERTPTRRTKRQTNRPSRSRWFFRRSIGMLECWSVASLHCSIAPSLQYTTAPSLGALMSLIRLQGISRRYQMGAETIHALREVSLEIGRGEYVAIMGPSGSGKSTLMNLIGCVDTPTSDEYVHNGVRVSEMDDNQLAVIRHKEIGFIFQTFN